MPHSVVVRNSGTTGIQCTVVQPPLNIIVILVIHHNPAARTISDAIPEQSAESFKRNSLVYNGELNTEHM